MGTVFLQQQGGRSGTVLLGIILVGAGAGLGYYLLSRTMQPVPEIVPNSVSARSQEGISVQVRNVGKKTGYFKLQALVVPTTCPMVGTSGYGDNNNWSQVLTCPGAMWIAAPEGQGWHQVAPGATATLNAPPGTWGKLSAGQRNAYLNVVVATDPTGANKNRYRSRWAWYWTPVTIS